MTESIPLGEFRNTSQRLDSFGVALSGLISEVLKANGLSVHSVEFRVKSEHSVSRKLAIGSAKYADFNDLTDLLGVRVITYFEDEVDRVARVLTPEFSVDRENSVDKRSDHDPDRFGYLSLHYVATLNSDRVRLIEYQRFESLRFELQIRSILQHAWAEIEHDLGYKADGAVPRDVRRRFSRLAGLLELADDEFVRLRTDLERYERRIRSTISTRPATLDLDQSTLTALLETDEVKSLDQAIANLFRGPLSEDVVGSFISSQASELRNIFGVNHLKQLSHLIELRHQHVLKFAELWLEARVVEGTPRPSRGAPVQRGISMFYLMYTLVATSAAASLRDWKPPTGVTVADVVDVWDRVIDQLGQVPE